MTKDELVAYLTPELIISKAKHFGCFDVSLNYRDRWLVRRCQKMCDAGQLIYVGRIGGNHRFLTELPKTKEDVEGLMPVWGVEKHNLYHLLDK